MSKLEITGIKIDSEKDIESITINIEYKQKSADELDSTDKGEPQPKQPQPSNSPFKTVY